MWFERAFFLVVGVVFLSVSGWTQELRIGLSAEPSAMDPHYHNLTPNNSLLSHVFERLIEPDEQQASFQGWPRAGRASTTRPGSSSSARA